MNKKNNLIKSIVSYLPNTKILLFSLTAISLGVGMVVYKKNKAENRDLKKITLQAINGITINNEDSDNDGISDLEEKMLGTDPQKADTDGDGLSDSWEKQLGTDPRVPKEKDEIVKKKLEGYEKITLTNAVNRDLVAAALENQNKNLSDVEIVKITNQILKKNTPKQILKLKYKLSDIQSADQITIKQYKNSFIVAASDVSDNYINERIALYEYIGKPSVKTLAEAKKAISILRDLESKVSKIKVPTIARANHLKYINTLSVYLDTLEAVLESAVEDPVKAGTYYQHIDFLDKKVGDAMTVLKQLYFN